MANVPMPVRVYFDFDHDGLLSEGDDVTAYVMAADWSYGMGAAFQHVADEPELTLTLASPDRRFSPDVVTGPFYGKLLPGRKVQVVDATDGRALWTGRARRLAPAMGQYSGPFTAELAALGPKWLLENVEIDIELLENVTSDEVIAAVLAKVEFPPSYTRAWRLGVAGYSELGETTYLADTELSSNLETGLTTWPFAGDNFDRFGNAYDAIARAAAAERGRFFFDRDGVATFYSRAHFQLDMTVVATIDDTMASLSYSHGDEIVNDVRVTARARALSPTNGETLWTLDEPLTLRGGDEREMRARYASEEGQQVAGRNVQAPSTGAGTLGFSSGSATLSAFAAEARTATFRLTNDSASKECVVDTLVVKGQRVTSWNAQEVREQAQESISLYGRHTKTINEPLIADPGYAQNLAQYELLQHQAPQGRVTRLALENRDASSLALQRALDVGDRIAVHETQTGHSGEYFIVGAAYQWRDGGKYFKATYTLEPAASYSAWVLGVAGRSELGETTWLGL